MWFVYLLEVLGGLDLLVLIVLIVYGALKFRQIVQAVKSALFMYRMMQRSKLLRKR